MEEEVTFPYSTHEICSCCGTQFGLDVQDSKDIETVREEWLSSGAPWFDNEKDIFPSKPIYWSVSLAKEQIKDNIDNNDR